MHDIRALATDSTARHEYFSDDHHAADHLWLPGDEEHGFDFGYLTACDGLSVVDYFRGMRPRYHDRAHPDGDNVRLSVFGTLVLDSNVAGQLLAYLEGTMKDASARAAIERFLRWFCSTPDMNISPVYNLLERFPRSADQAKAEQMALRTARAILDIETIDRSYFLSTGRRRTAPDAPEILRSQHGTDDLNLLARNAVNDTARLAQDQVDAHYAFALKVAMIDAQYRRAELATKINKTIAFSKDRLGLVGPIEMATAMMQFTGSLGKFLTINRGMTFEQIVVRAQHAAWDLAYIRTPQMYLFGSIPARTTLGFVITNDKEAAAIMRLSSFAMLLVTPDSRRSFSDVDFATVRQSFRDLTAFDDAHLRIQDFVQKRSLERPTQPDTAALISDLEIELRSFLR